MRKFSARWWVTPLLSQWRSMTAYGNYDGGFAHFPYLNLKLESMNYIAPDSLGTLRLHRVGVPVAEPVGVDRIPSLREDGTWDGSWHSLIELALEAFWSGKISGVAVDSNGHVVLSIPAVEAKERYDYEVCGHKSC